MCIYRINSSNGIIQIKFCNEILLLLCGWKRTWKKFRPDRRSNPGLWNNWRQGPIKHASKLSIYGERTESSHERTPLASRVTSRALPNGEGENEITFFNIWNTIHCRWRKIRQKKKNNCHSLASYTWVDGINWPPPRDWEAIFNVSIAIPLVERLEALWVVCGLYIE